MPKTSASNSTGVILAPAQSQIGSGGRLFNVTIGAEEVYRANSRGLQAYLVVATASVNMRPLGGDFTIYSVGTGINTLSPFEYIEVENFNSFPVVISLWIGFDSFIDNRLIIANSSNPNIAFPTYSVPLSATFVNIVDLSGGAFEDLDGTIWLPLYRVAINIFNLDPGNTYKLGKYSPTGADLDEYIASVPPAPLPISLAMSGNYTYNPGGSVNAIISEIYSCIPQQNT